MKIVGTRGEGAGQGFSALRNLGAAALTSASLCACASASLPPATLGAGARAYNRPYQVHGRWYTPADQPRYDAVGTASWYSYESRSRTTADGEPFDARLATAAHTTLPIPSYLDVTNLQNGRTLRVRLNDRGPFAAGRIIDLSRAAAEQLGFLGRGTTRVRVRYVGPAPLHARAELMLADAPPPAATTLPPQQALAAEPASEAGRAREALMEGAAERAVSPTGQAGFAVQAGAFADFANAERAATRLAGAGSTVVRPLETDGSRRRFYRVIVGPWSDEEAASSARARIAALGFRGAEVIRAD